MNKVGALKAGIAALLAIPAGMAGFSALSAQQAGEDNVNIVFVYGEDACPPSQNGEIVVCSRFDEGERYRIPPELRGNLDSPENRSWTSRVKSYEMIGASGPMSCSPTGAGGATGCTQALVDEWQAEKSSATSGRASNIINAQREERLSALDAEAAAEQARVDEAIAKQEELREQVDSNQEAPPSVLP